MNHFRTEEEVLFPLFINYVEEKGELTDLITRIVAEHKKVRRMISNLSTVPENGIAARLKEIGEHIEKHIRTEERKLFEAIQERLPEEELKRIGPILRTRCVLRCSSLL